MHRYSKRLRTMQQHVFLYKYWQESLSLFGIFLRKLQQYSNTSLLLFTQLFQLLAPGNPFCFNQHHLEWWRFLFSVSDRHGAFPCTKFSWETFVHVYPTANVYLRGSWKRSLYFLLLLFIPMLYVSLIYFQIRKWTQEKQRNYCQQLEYLRNIWKIRSCSFSEAFNLSLVLLSSSVFFLQLTREQKIVQ